MHITEIWQVTLIKQDSDTEFVLIKDGFASRANGAVCESRRWLIAISFIADYMALKEQLEVLIDRETLP